MKTILTFLILLLLSTLRLIVSPETALVINTTLIDTVLITDTISAAGSVLITGSILAAGFTPVAGSASAIGFILIAKPTLRYR